MRTSTATSRADLYSRVTERVIADLEKGVRPWLKPWSAGNTAGRVGLPRRHNGVPYRGINVLVLWGDALDKGYGSSTWMTFKQALALGGHVRKGEHGSVIVYADRIQAVIAEDGPQIPARDENRYITRLNYQSRNIADELTLIETLRRQITPLLHSLDAADYQRVGIHSIDGPLDLKTLLARISGHVRHHAEFIARKKQLLLKPA